MSHALVFEPDDEPPPAAPPVDRFDMEIVEFMLSWAPYGGPPEDECVPQFGMSRDRLLARFHQIVSTGERRNLGMADRVMLDRASELVDVAAKVAEPTVVDTTVVDPTVVDTTALDSPPSRRWVLRQGVWRWK